MFFKTPPVVSHNPQGRIQLFPSAVQVPIPPPHIRPPGHAFCSLVPELLSASWLSDFLSLACTAVGPPRPAGCDNLSTCLPLLLMALFSRCPHLQPGLCLPRSQLLPQGREQLPVQGRQPQILPELAKSVYCICSTNSTEYQVLAGYWPGAGHQEVSEEVFSALKELTLTPLFLAQLNVHLRTKHCRHPFRGALLHTHACLTLSAVVGSVLTLCSEPGCLS